jgi:hypothetical protein
MYDDVRKGFCNACANALRMLKIAKKLKMAFVGAGFWLADAPIGH